MKRFYGIFFLTLVIFNMVGYHCLLSLIQRQLTAPFLQRIESKARELGGNLIFAIPLQLPYASDSEEYTQIEGEVVYQGDIYRLLKQKFYRNMLYIVCIKDNLSTKSRAEMADNSRLFSGQQAESTDSNIKIMNSLSKYYTATLFSVKPEANGWHTILKCEQFKNLYCFDATISIFNPPKG